MVASKGHKTHVRHSPRMVTGRAGPTTATAISLTAEKGEKIAVLP